MALKKILCGKSLTVGSSKELLRHRHTGTDRAGREQRTQRLWEEPGPAGARTRSAGLGGFASHLQNLPSIWARRAGRDSTRNARRFQRCDRCLQRGECSLFFPLKRKGLLIALRWEANMETDEAGGITGFPLPPVCGGRLRTTELCPVLQCTALPAAPSALLTYFSYKNVHQPSSPTDTTPSTTRTQRGFKTLPTGSQ